MDADAQFERELFKPEARAELIDNNRLTRAIGDQLWDWFRGTDEDAVVFALKAFPMNVHIDAASMRHGVKCVLAARAEVTRSDE